MYVYMYIPGRQGIKRYTQRQKNHRKMLFTQQILIYRSTGYQKLFATSKEPTYLKAAQMEAEELAVLDAEVRVVAGTTARPMVSLSLARSLARSPAHPPARPPAPGPARALSRALSLARSLSHSSGIFHAGIHFFFCFPVCVLCGSGVCVCVCGSGVCVCVCGSLLALISCS